MTGCGAQSLSADVEEHHRIGRAPHLQGCWTACEHRCDSRFLQQTPHLRDHDISSEMIT